ncbi:MAG: hypothetical protein GX856_04420 [Gammaproteobacteria bacterium]|nr:hypothetical protein [Gammaproteobacteria bacterium]
MTSLRTFRLASTTGHVIRFQAKVPTFVPDAAVPEAMAAGCVPVDEADVPFYEDLSRAKVEFNGDVRKSMLFLAVKTLTLKNDYKNFDAGGNPKVKPVSEMIGFEVNRQELLDIFRIYQQSVAENVDYPLHPAAPNILKVLEAEDKGELLELAEEFGVDKDKAKGLQGRDLRKLLLVKLSGVEVG